MYCRTKLLSWVLRIGWGQPGVAVLCSSRHAFPRNGYSHERLCNVCFKEKTQPFMSRLNNSPWLGSFTSTYGSYARQHWTVQLNSGISMNNRHRPGHTVTQGPRTDVLTKWFFICDLSRCACGQLTTQHVAIPPGANSVEETQQLVQIDTPKDKWNVIKHTRTYPTDAFGLIEFQGGGFINKAMVSLKNDFCVYIAGLVRGYNSRREVSGCNIAFKYTKLTVDSRNNFPFCSFLVYSSLLWHQTRQPPAFDGEGLAVGAPHLAHFRTRRSPKLWPPAQTQASVWQRPDQSCRHHRSLDLHGRSQYG